MKTILITGGAKGIGEAIVKEAINDFNVAFTFNNSKDKAQALMDGLKDKGGIFSTRLNALDLNSINEAVDKVLERFQKIDVLVLNAGIAHQQMFCDISPVDFDKMIDTNFKGAFHLIQKVLPQMISRKSGKIIAISSMWGETGGSCEVDYSASKAAIIGMCKALAKEVAPSGITVNVVSPGVIDTDMMASFSKEDKENLIEEIPLHRMGTPKDVADAVMCFAKGLDYVTGAVLRVNGGILI